MVPFKSFMAMMTLVHQLGVSDVEFHPTKKDEMILNLNYDKWEKFTNLCNDGDVNVCTFIAEHLSEISLDPVKKECKMVYKF